MRKVRLRHLTLVAPGAMLLLIASPAPAATIGSDLFGTPDTGVCALSTPGGR